MRYIKGNFKYQLDELFEYQTGLTLPFAVGNGFIRIGMDGILSIKPGYAWDGPSGPALDTPNFQTASLVHDALYQAMREKMIAQHYRSYADLLMKKICLEKGMSKFRAKYTYWAVKRWARKAADPRNVRQVLTAP